MGAPLADPAKLLAILAIPEDEREEVERAALVIELVSDYARGEARQDAWTLENAPSNVTAIVMFAAASCFSNPDRKTSVTVEEVTRRWEKGDLFSSSQLATLRGFRKGTKGLGTIQYTRPDDMPEVTVPVIGGSGVHLYDGRGY